MSEYSANLDLVVTSKGVNKADKGLTRIQKQGAKAERATDGVGRAFTRVIAPIAAFVSVTAGLKKITDITRQYDIFKASLETATGSAQNASIAFEALEEFAKRTPYELEQSVDAFNKLVNLGLNPSERALTSYGDTAAAMGKDLTQFIEAVADASTNEFERLKEFGIKASQQADTVSFTFRGVTTTVKKSAEEIEEYLIGLGENNFDGAMKRRMDSLDGAISNLGDTWDGLFRTVSDKGVGAIIEDGVNTATEAINELDTLLQSGQLEQYSTALGSIFDGYAKDATRTFDLVADFFQEHAEKIGVDTDELVNFMSDSMSNLPQNIRAFIQLMTVELASFIDKTSAYGQEILENLQFWKDESFDLDGELKKIDQTRLSSIDSILKERDTAVGSTELQIEKARSLREEYDKVEASRKKATVDDLDLNRGKSSTVEGPDAQSKKEFEHLITKVIPSEDRINEVFEKRLQLIRDNTEAGSQAQAELIERLNKDYATDILNGFEVEPDEYDFDAQVDLINQDFENRREVILANTKITEEQRTALEAQLTESRAQKLAAIEKQQFKARLGIAKSMLGNLSTLMNSESKKMFEIGKVAAIANAIVAGVESTIHSYNFGSKIGGPVLGAAFAATAAAATLVQIQQLRSQSFGGGGTVSPGGSGSSPSTNVYEPPQPTQPVGPNNPAEAQEQQPIQIIFNGPVNGLDAEHIAESLKEHIDQTDFVLISSSSRNGQELQEVA